MASEQHIIYARAETATSAALAKDRFVGISSGKVVHATSLALPYGVSIGAVAATTVEEDRKVTIGMVGVFSIEAASASIAKGAMVGVGSLGRAVTATAARSYAGIALTSAAALEVFPILFVPGRSS
jgi:hypothetical protein